MNHSKNNKSIIENIKQSSYVSIYSDNKFDYEFILADKDGVFILPVIDNEKIILREEPVAAYHYYNNEGEKVPGPEDTDKHFTLAGGGIEENLEDLRKLSEEEYLNIALDNAERECWEEVGIQLIDKNTNFRTLYNEHRIHVVGPLFLSKYNSFRCTLMLVFLNSDEIVMKKPPTDGSEVEKLSNNISLPISRLPWQSMKSSTDMGVALLISELQNFISGSIIPENIKLINKLKKRIIEMNYITENTNNNRGHSLVVGRFQPFTDGHLKMITKLFHKTEAMVIIGIVEGAKSAKNKEQNPLNFEQRADLVRRALSETDIPYLIIKVASGYLPDVIEVINKTIGTQVSRLYMACGSDRYATYTRLLDKAKEEFEGFDYELVEIERNDEDISASKIRHAIKTNDYVFYKDNMPTGINDETTFIKLQGILTIQ